MKLSKITEELDLELVTDIGEDVDVEGVYIGDLLSLVMARAEEKQIWITIQTHINVMAVATLVELSAVLIAEGVEIDKDTIEKANEVKIPIVKSNLSAYELACKLNNLGV